MKFTATHLLILIALLVTGAIVSGVLGQEALATAFGIGAAVPLVGAIVMTMRGGGGPTAPAVIVLILALAMGSSGCASFRPMAAGADGQLQTCAGGPCYSPERCDRLRAKYRAWGAVSYGGTAVAGAGGFAALFGQDDRLQRWAGAGTVVLAVIVGLSTFLRGDYAEEHADFCSPARVEPARPVTP